MKQRFSIHKRSDNKWWVWFAPEARWLGPFETYPEDYAE